MFTRAKIRIQNVLKRQILTDSIGNSINYICERGRVGNILNSVVFPLRSELFNFKSIKPSLNFSDLNYYSTEISS